MALTFNATLYKRHLPAGETKLIYQPASEKQSIESTVPAKSKGQQAVDIAYLGSTFSRAVQIADEVNARTVKQRRMQPFVDYESPRKSIVNKTENIQGCGNTDSPICL